MRSTMTRLLRALAVTGLLVGAALAQATGYNFSTVTLPGYEGTNVFGINNAGQIAGYGYNPSGPTQGFFGAPGSLTLLSGPAGALGTWGMGISNTGVVVGGFYASQVLDPNTGALVPGPSQGFAYAGGSYSVIGSGPGDTNLRAVSPNGRYVGGYTTLPPDHFPSQGFVLDRSTGTTTLIGDGSSFMIPQGISDSGVLVGSDRIPGAGTAGRVGFVYDLNTGTRSNYAHPGAFSTAFRDMNASGVIVGWAAMGANTVGLIGTPGSFEAIAFPGATFTYIEGINDAGWIAGEYDLGDGVMHGFIARPVPEPAAWALMLLGLAGVTAAARRRR